MLPLELYKIIIDNLHNDVAALYACSLTCKAFLHASRSILFRDLHLREMRLEPLTNLYTYVRSLFLYEGEGVDPWLNYALPLIATSLQHVTTLKLQSLEWEFLDDTARSMLLSGFREVEELEITFCRFETSAQLNELIASFPSLKNLSCSSPLWDAYLLPVVPLPLNITSITLSSFHTRFFDQLLNIEPHPIVHILKFNLIRWEDFNDMGVLLKKLGSHLERLHLESHSYGFYRNPQRLRESNINLSHNTHLRSIRLDYRLIFAFRPGSVADILWSQIASPRLERIVLEISLPSLVDLDRVDWPQIDDYFQQRWTNLHHLVFILSDSIWYRPAAKEIIQARLPLLRDRGALVVLDLK